MVKPGYRLREGDQIPTRLVSLTQIMSRPTFVLGAADARAGRPFHRDYDIWDTNGQWSYERGRAWARIAPANVPLKISGKLNPKAMQFYGDDII